MENKGVQLEDSVFMGYALCMASSPLILLNPFTTLQQNAADLFQQIQERNSSRMICQSGCSKCCHVEFSIFQGEALLILEWFKKLSAEEKAGVKAAWNQKPHGKACKFLRNHHCSIYQARPIICRTQGAPLSFSAERKENITKTVDCCPLNFEGGKGIPKNASDWFDLDRLTSLQAIAENYVLKNFEIPAEIQSISDESGRISLAQLQSLLASLTN